MDTLSSDPIIPLISPAAQLLHLPDGSAAYMVEVSPELARTDVFAEQFEPTMEKVAQLSHPAILPVLEFGVRDGTAYLVTPYVTRGSLAGEIAMTGPPPPLRVVEIVAQLADALDTLHNQELIHCGLSAEAVLRGQEGSVMLSGLGLSDLTYQAVGVTPEMLPYAAPELLIKAPYTVRVDIYALGILAYHLLAGRPPFSGRTTTQYMQAHLRQPLPTLGGDVPEQMTLVLKRATGKLAHSRYWTAREMAHDLEIAAGLKAHTQLPKPNRSLSQIITRYRSLRSAPARQRGSLKVSQMYTEALLREKQNPAEARQMYRQIIELWPRMAQGDVLDRLMALEREMLAGQVEMIHSQAQRALNRGDWAVLLNASQELLEVNPGHAEGEQMRGHASTMLAAEEHYRAAALAESLGDMAASLQLTQELFSAVPNFTDSAGLTVISPGRAARVRETATLKAHESNILSLEFSMDGRLLASGSTDKHVRIGWLPRLEASAQLDPFHSWVCTLAFSPDGETMLTGLWDGEIRLWSLPDGDYKGMIAGLVNQIQAMSFAHHQPDHVAVAAGSFLTVWQVPSGKRITTVKENDLNSISALAYSPAAPWLVCGMTHGTLRIRDASRPDYPVITDIAVHHAAVFDPRSMIATRRHRASDSSRRFNRLNMGLSLDE